MRLLTVNMYAGSSDAGAFGDLLDLHQPDVVAVQELSPRVASVLAKTYPHGLIRPALNHRGAALVSTRPISVARRALPHRPALNGVTTLENGAKLNIWSVHMVNPAAWPPPVWLRGRQVEELLTATIESDGPAAIVGDFNATPLWPVYREVEKHFADGVADWAERTGTRPEATWAYRPGLKPLLRIDHVFVRDLVVADVQNLPIAGSDHRGLLVDLVQSL